VADVDFEHVDKEYAPGDPVVRGVDLHVDDAELMVVVGPSGCGKSTLLRLLAGLETVTRGTLRIGGRTVNDLTPQDRNVAMVFQDYALYPHRTVRGNLEFPLRMRGLGREEIRRRVEWAASLLGLAGALGRLPRQLSGGERQRVAMGRALVREPSVFLLDEPLSNLDAKLRVEVRAEIAELQRRTRTTMLYVTHDQVEAMTLGQRITVLDRGRVQQIGTPREVYERPANVFVAGFIGNPPMNLFPTRISLDAGQARMSVGEQLVPLDGVEGVEGGALAGLAGRLLRAGVRAEALSLRSGNEVEGALEARIEHVECLGHETLASVRAGATPDGVRLVVRVAAMRDFTQGERVLISIDPRGVYLFGEDGSALRSVPPPQRGDP
jgi:multiple sugar transport system ATP-binding protein